jgi:hypothetical protein
VGDHVTRARPSSRERPILACRNGQGAPSSAGSVRSQTATSRSAVTWLVGLQCVFGPSGPDPICQPTQPAAFQARAESASRGSSGRPLESGPQMGTAQHGDVAPQDEQRVGDASDIAAELGSCARGVPFWAGCPGARPGRRAVRPASRPDWSRPVRTVARSTLARKHRYAPVASGTGSPSDSRPAALNGTSRHNLIDIRELAG